MQTLRLATLFLCLTATAAFAQTVPYKRLVPSDTVRATFLNEVTTSGSIVLVKEFIVFHGGTVRLSWRHKSNGAQAVFVRVRQKVHGSIDFCTEATISAAYQNAGCEVPVEAGAVIQVFLTSSSGQNVWIRNLRLMFDMVEATKPAVALP